MDGIPEKDWKYLRSVQGELIEAFCERINTGALKILADPRFSQHEKYLRLYSYLMKKDKIVAECFNDWRRSTILYRLISLRRHHLLTDEQFSHLSVETQSKINFISSL